MEPLRIGVLGAARISEYSIVLPAQLIGARLVAVAARDQDRAASFAARHGVERVVGSYQALVEDPEIEAVYNPLANGLHGPWNLRAIAAGKHVLTEKPSASNEQEAREVERAASAAGVHAIEAFHYRYHPVMLRMMDLVSSGALGAIERIDAHMAIPAPPFEDPRWSLALAGGALMDLGCYGLHASRTLGAFLGGDPTILAARGGELRGSPGVDEWIDVDLAFASGAVGLVKCSMVADAVEFTLRIKGSRGEALAHNLLAPASDDRIRVTIDGVTRIEELGRRSSYTYQLDAFTRLLRAGTPMVTDAADAVVNMRMIDAVYDAVGFGPRPIFR
jgi:predicted dehydrogenase